jgi:plastocyanin
MRQHLGTHFTLASAGFVGLVAVGATVGVGLARPTGAHPLAGTNPAAASMVESHSAMASMAEYHLPAAKTTQGTVIHLHQRVVHLTIQNFAFEPARLVVSPGTRLVWTNKDTAPHTVTSTKGIWSSAVLNTGSQFARTFSTAGSFPYYCSIHPFMRATIIVHK